MTTPELRPCPFCGGDAEITQHAGYVNRKAYYVGCSDELCSIQPYSFGPLEQAIAAWNRRAVPCHQCVSLRKDFEKRYDELIKSWALDMSDKVKE